jgi:MoaA/NifB/PqqE/SkfB family radical SAM enzyme
MSGKFIRRTLRNILLRDRPYFAHLALTHRCNLHCRFCHIPETRFTELDTEGMKRVIDVLDQLGVAVISISGGGEPLLRNDFDEIVNYADEKGLYTKLTSNGTMPLDRYRRLLASSVKEIGISLDGVEGEDLPFSHVGQRILQAIHYLDGNLPEGKHLTLNVTVTAANHRAVPTIVAYCAREFPHARVWLNPVVSGEGKLRTVTDGALNPGYMETCSSPTLLSAGFYTKAVWQQYRNERFNWGCLAGNLFFDVKPNGDLWMCQDHPSRQPLNVLEPGFSTKLKTADFSHRRECSGCTYSCYLVPQKGFEWRNWPDMAGLWWMANTQPGEECRAVADRKGWVAGLLQLCADRLLPAFGKAVFGSLLALLLMVGQISGQPGPVLTDPEGLVAKMEERNAARQQTLPAYEGTRRYIADNQQLGKHAETTATFRFLPPSTRSIEVTRRAGSGIVHRLVIEPILAAERAAAAGKGGRRDVDICRRNYLFEYVGYDADRRAWIFTAEPRTPNKYLFRGRIWVDEADFGISRIEGQPAKSPSYWVKQTAFVHEYQRHDVFWLPAHHESVAELRVFGQSTLTIDYSGYKLATAPASTVSAAIR